jgi:ubiquinone/menaquinone biosynthesis C-methylase UbiE
MPIRWVFRFFSRGPKRLTPSLRDQIRRSFDEASRDEEHFPSTIDPRIYHVRLIQEYFGDLSGKRILDAGCGKGRFARILRENCATAQMCGLDLSPEMLKFLPEGVRGVAGSMTMLPFDSEQFDCVYATESLEHAVEIETAVGELCRVLKPGGRLVIIDKNAEHFGKLKTPEWEKWFDRKEVEELLRRDCREVSSRFISYWEDVEPDGMFLAWLAQK